MVIISLFVCSSHQYSLVVLYWSLCDSKSPQISMTLSILTYLNNAIVWIVITHPPISSSSSTLSYFWGTIPSTPITVGITITLIFCCFFFSFPAKSKYLSLFLLSLIFTSVVHWDGKVHYMATSLFFC